MLSLLEPSAHLLARSQLSAGSASPSARAWRGPCPALTGGVAEGWRLPSLQVHQLYETTQRWSPVATSLPELVQRLVSIKQLHEQGGRPAPGVSRGTGKGATLFPPLWSWILMPCLPFWPFTAMQFGQLLTHLDTTQQMIACSLKDNAALLTQVSAPLLVGCLPSPAHTGKVLQLQLRRGLPRPTWWHSGAAGVWCESPYGFPVAVRRLTTYLTCDPPSHHLANCTCFSYMA